MLILKDIVKDTYTNASGYALYVAIEPYFIENNVVKISFKDLTPMSTSFLNSSIGPLIDQYGIDQFKRIFKPAFIKKSQADSLIKYIAICKKMVS